MRKLWIAAALLPSSLAHADAGFDSALENYNSCYRTQLDRLASLCEPADQVAVAVTMACQTELRRFESASIKWVGVDRGRKLVSHLIETRKQQAIASIIEQRAANPCN